MQIMTITELYKLIHMTHNQQTEHVSFWTNEEQIKQIEHFMARYGLNKSQAMRALTSHAVNCPSSEFIKTLEQIRPPQDDNSS